MFINPRRMRHRVTVVVLSVCVSVTTAYLVCTSITRCHWVFSRFLLCAFAENTLFKSSGVICRSPLPFELPDELAMDRRDGVSFFSTRRVYTVSDSIYNMTNH